MNSVFALSYGFKSIGLRYFNVFGKRQDPNGAYVAVIPKWTAAMVHEYGISLTDKPERGSYSGVILAVPHREYSAMIASDIRGYLTEEGVLYDLNGILPLGEADCRL